MKVLILSCSTGEGHNSAAKAISETLVSMNIDCTIMDPIVLKSKKVSNTVASAYNGLIRKAPGLFGIVYKLGSFYEWLRLPSPVYWANSKCAGELYEYIRNNQIDAVICTHIFGMQSMTAVRRKYGPVPCYGVLTDHTAIPFLSETDIDGYFVPDDGVVYQLKKKGIPEDRIYVTGIPVSRRFSIPITKEDARAALGIPKDKKIIVLMSGGAGCGKILKLCKRMCKSLDSSHLIYVFPGKNEKLRKKLETRFSGEDRVVTVAFTLEMHMYVKAADVVLSKPGGLSSTEIAVAGVPLVHLKAIPGCETCNMRYYTSSGLSLPGKSVKQAVAATEKLLIDTAASESMREKQRRLILSNAAQVIADRVIKEVG